MCVRNKRSTLIPSCVGELKRRIILADPFFSGGVLCLCRKENLSGVSILHAPASQQTSFDCLRDGDPEKENEELLNIYINKSVWHQRIDMKLSFLDF